MIEGRNGKQCRERWFNTLNPKVVKGNWNIEEDFLIFFFYNCLGGKWTTISSNLNGRTENSIKNRFYSTLRKKVIEIIKYDNKFNDDVTNDNNNNKNENKNENEKKTKKKTSYSIEELIVYFPAIYNEVTQRYKRYKNISNEELENIKIEILKNIVFNKNDIETPNINYNNLNNNNEIYPNQSNEINEQNLEINLNLNLLKNKNPNQNDNSVSKEIQINNNDNNYIIKNNDNNCNLNLFEKDKDKYKEKDTISLNTENYPKYLTTNNSSKTNSLLVGRLEFNLNNNDHEFDPNDIFSLEKNISEMCDNPSFIYSNYDYNDIFMINNENINNYLFEKETEKSNQENFNFIEEEKNKNNDFEEISKNKDTKIYNNNLNKNNDIEIINESVGNKRKNSTTAFTNLSNEIFKEKDKNKNFKNNYSKLLCQLEDLEKIVKTTKKELGKYNRKIKKNK